MNNQKRSLSAASIVSMIGAMLFAIAAACMIFLPTISVSKIPSENEKYTGVFISPYSVINASLTSSSINNLNDIKDKVGNSSVMDVSIIGTSGKSFMDNKKELDKSFEQAQGGSEKSELYDTFKKAYDNNNFQVIFASVAFFGVIACALFVVLGKALQMTNGGRILGVVFSLIGTFIALGYLIFTLINMGELNKFFENMGLRGYKDRVSIGAGPILMASFAAVSFIFCLIGNGKSAYKLAPPPANIYNPNSTYNGYNDGFNTNNTAQPPVQPQQPYNSYNPGGYAQPQNPYAPPVQQQNPYAVPVQPQNPYAYPVQPQPARPVSGEGTIPLSQINKGSGVSGEGTIPLNQINKGSGVSGEGTIPLNQINKSSGMSGEGTVPLNRVHSQSGEETVPLNRVRSQSGEGTIPLNMVGTVQKNTVAGTLKCIKGDFPAMSVDLKSDEKIIIGRDPSACSVIVGADRSDVSRTHCSVWYDPIKDSFKIKDTSSNGTFVNGQKLPKDQTVQIPDNSVISLGNGDNQFKIIKN